MGRDGVMKIDYKFWLFLIVFSLSQCLVALSLNYRISTDMMMILNKLSDQIDCQLGDNPTCEILEQQKEFSNTLKNR